ncbi:ThiF domain-containing protein [Candidatus Hydrogenisulfobacillus filiaventi]|uniref:ThiF domain-containing protein n=1 Tax=Candidatus Hydrogenisulfobacillus filiaventi TaxID=2707344 RepID=A0A6F8ZEI7_9FIRM|nr:ThiF family adenylyltransferase [Bacillota bacterium]CAB1128416.1 ThiF domain-containing protein [Candidatus Hydrogenisulfobacillus filiaventi]
MQVALVGAGALGSPLAWALVRLPAVTRLTVVDGDRVALSNLPRQPWYGPDDLGRPKAALLAERVAAAGGPAVEARIEMVTAANAGRLLADAELVVDGSDNWAARRTIEAFAAARGIPWIYAAALGWDGLTAWMAPDGPCLRCWFGEPGGDGPRCFEAGAVGAVTLAVAGVAVAELERRLAGEDPPPRLWLVDGRRGRVTALGGPPAPCPHRRPA